MGWRHVPGGEFSQLPETQCFSGEQMIPKFSMVNVAANIQNFIEAKKQRAIWAFIRAGEQFVNLAKQGGAYTDRTANLRNSLGYAIAMDGDIIEFSCPKSPGKHGGPEATKAAHDTASEVASKYKSGIVLIGFAGMEYAAAVESRGYDVITGSMPETEKLLNEALEDAGLT